MQPNESRRQAMAILIMTIPFVVRFHVAGQAALSKKFRSW
jgi:hypothetical protein